MKDERVYLGHIRDAINDIKSYATVGEAAFLADRMRLDAVIRKLEHELLAECSGAGGRWRIGRVG